MGKTSTSNTSINVEGGILLKVSKHDFTFIREMRVTAPRWRLVSKSVYHQYKVPFKYYVSKEVGGWGQKMAICADLQLYYIC